MEPLFKEQIRLLKAYRSDRKILSDKVLMEQSLFPTLVRLCFCDDPGISYRACWVLEYVCLEKLQLLFPYLQLFLTQLPALKNESSKRSCAKVCELLCQNYYLRKDSEIRQLITKSQLEQLAEINFDWLISDSKVAAKAYAMECLRLLGSDFKWIYPELKAILLKGIPKHSMAYSARAKPILKKI